MGTSEFQKILWAKISKKTKKATKILVSRKNVLQSFSEVENVSRRNRKIKKRLQKIAHEQPKILLYIHDA